MLDGMKFNKQSVDIANEFLEPKSVQVFSSRLSALIMWFLCRKRPTVKANGLYETDTGQKVCRWLEPVADCVNDLHPRQ